MINSKKNTYFEGGLTVLMALYKNDDSKLFEKAILSIFANTVLPDFFILVVDGPIPKSLRSIITKYSLKLDVYFLRTNRGLSYALNFGLAQVKTRWVARADSDDINRVNRFELQGNFLKSAQNVTDILGGCIHEIDESGNYLGIRKVPYTHTQILNFTKYRSPFNHMTIIFKVSLANKIGGYPHIKFKEDYAFFITMIQNGAVCNNMQEILVDATTNNKTYLRRGGLDYIFSEIEIQKLLISNNISSRQSAFFIGLSRAIIFSLPVTIKKLFYRSILRGN